MADFKSEKILVHKKNNLHKLNIQSHIEFNKLSQEISWKEEFKKNKNQNFNIGYRTTKKHLHSEISHKIALKIVGKEWPQKKEAITNVTYHQLDQQSDLVSWGLQELGVQPKESVFLILPRRAEFYSLALGVLKSGAQLSCLFSAFGPEPLQVRLLKGHAKILISLKSYYQRKIEPILKFLPELKHLILINDLPESLEIPNTLEYKSWMQKTKILSQTGYFNNKESVVFCKPEDPALIHFTSGTTGQPKGAVHVHGAVLYHEISAKLCLDLQSEDLFWCTADPGWVTGMSYGVIAPLLIGATLLIDEADFEAQRWMQILQEFRVTNWYTAPTALRMLMKQGNDFFKPFHFENLRIASSVGEPLNPEVIYWAKENLHLLIHDNWWQTETGGIAISNFGFMNIKPGSMGKAVPGMEIRLAQQLADGTLKFITQPHEQGEIILHKGWPSQFKTYLEQEDRYQKCFIGDWYLSGDLATQDEEGYYWFVGRKDDVIKSSGHLIGPFEVESVLLEHPKVAEAGVIGKPDPVAGEIVKAFISLKKGEVFSEDLKMEILALARKKLGPAVAPRELDFIESLPKTRSGKIMRRLLRARELHLPEGDLSTLEPS